MSAFGTPVKLFLIWLFFCMSSTRDTFFLDISLIFLLEGIINCSLGCSHPGTWHTLLVHQSARGFHQLLHDSFHDWINQGIAWIRISPLTGSWRTCTYLGWLSSRVIRSSIGDWPRGTLSVGNGRSVWYSQLIRSLLYSCLKRDLFSLLLLPALSSLFHISLSSSVLAKVFLTRSSSSLVSFRCSMVLLFFSCSLGRHCSFQLWSRRGSLATHFLMESLISPPQIGPKPGFEKHLSRLVHPDGTLPGFVPQVASRESSISQSHNTQTWAVQYFLLAPSCHQQNFHGAVPTVVMPWNVRQSSCQQCHL